MNVTFDEILESKQNSHPLIILLLLQEDILLETVIILDALTGFVERENKRISDTIIWPDIYRKITKYKPFVNFNRDKCLSIVKKQFTNG